MNGNLSDETNGPISHLPQQTPASHTGGSHNLTDFNGAGTSQDQPDNDAIKMFVGQIPKIWDENKLRQLFEKYGRIYQLNVLREKGVNVSKGCCFVTFYTRKSALAAQNELHNLKTLPGMHHPVQVKPADCEGRNEERKLFIGMLSKKCTEQDVVRMFGVYGEIEECRVLCNPDGLSKGCAFVTYGKKHMAQTAIQNMHHSTTMEGCSAPLVVKIADTPRDKERKKLQSQMQNHMNALTSQWKNVTNLALLAPLLQGALTNPLAMGNAGGLSPTQVQKIVAVAAAAQSILNTQQNGATNLVNGAHNGLAHSPGPSNGSSGAPLSSMSSPHNSNNVSVNSGLNNYRSQNHTTSPMWHQHSGASYSNPQIPPMKNGIPPINPLTQLANSMGISGGIPQGNMTSPTTPMSPNSLSNVLANMNLSPQSPTSMYGPGSPNQHSIAVGSQKEGPEGANLFIYHLPSEFTDHDLIQTFSPFGTVISAKVFIDKQTNLSKCFGFVSYDSPTAAPVAIHAMNGFQIGMKRLKVQLKRSKNDAAKNY